MEKPNLIRVDDTIFNASQITQVEISHTEIGHTQLVTIYFSDGKSKAFRNQAAAAALAALAPLVTEMKVE
jgi:hypothetical protein